MNARLWGIALICAAGCRQQPVDPLSCGDGTTRDGARCIAIPQLQVTCAEGTHLQDGACLPGITACDTGTHLEAGRCVVDATACAPGTELKDGRCIVTVHTDPPTRWKQNVRVCPVLSRCYDGVFTVAAPGNIVVAYSKELTRSLAVGIAVSTDDGATFIEQKQLEVASHYAVAPGIVADGAGNVLVSFTEYVADQSGQGNGTGNLWVVSSTDKGATWSAPVEATAPGEALDYQATLARSGSTYFMLWQRYDATGAIAQLSQSTDQGATWSAPREVPADPGAYGQFVFGHPAVPLADGHLLLPYQSIAYDLTNGGYLSHAGFLNIDPSPSPIATVAQDFKTLAYSSGQKLDAETALAADPANQHSCAVFLDAPSRDYTLYGVVASGGPFAPDQKPHAIDLSASTQLGPSVALGADGECHLVWLDNRRGGWELWSGVLRPDGTLADREVVSDQAFYEDGKLTITTLTGLQVVGATRYAIWNDTREGQPSVFFSRGPLDPPGM
ncbi:MAG: exo-alpha-sialidase [Archangiaceae bacterium]|nr:exo-alpha-sialidase [Archangiaceae bacterium]